jgi:hypothetical protein
MRSAKLTERALVNDPTLIVELSPWEESGQRSRFP